MLLLYVVREIFALEDAVSFNFALGAPHVKRRVKSRRPTSAAQFWTFTEWACHLMMTSLVVSPHKGLVMRHIDIFFGVILDKMLKKGELQVTLDTMTFT